MSLPRGPLAALLPAAAVAIGALALAGPAAADGYCGSDHDALTACPISTNGTVTGSYAAGVNVDQDVDFFVFYARPHTSVSLTLENTQSPTCSIPSDPDFGCGTVDATLYNSRGGNVTPTLSSTPQNGIPQPDSASARLAGGVYYVETGGFSTQQGLTYSITVDVSPAVQWPEPCLVPRLHGGTLLATAKRRLRADRCAVGRVVYRTDVHVRRGDVISLRPRAGTYLAAGAKVEIVVSGRPPRHRGHHRRHRRRR